MPTNWVHMRVAEYSDYHCPECGQGYEVVRWDTEYGDAFDGTFVIMCDCGKKFKVVVVVKVVYEVVMMA